MNDEVNTLRIESACSYWDSHFQALPASWKARQSLLGKLLNSVYDRIERYS
ncbi:MAG: hypothetical protein ACHBN1_19315 [Heteroscytonema crispum UTEX LB 1556]